MMAALRKRICKCGHVTLTLRAHYIHVMVEHSEAKVYRRDRQKKFQLERFDDVNRRRTDTKGEEGSGD